MLINSLIAVVTLATNGVSTSHVFVHQFSSRLEQKAATELSAAFSTAHKVSVPVFNELTLDGKKTCVLDGTMPAYARCYISFFGANARIRSVRLDFPE